MFLQPTVVRVDGLDRARTYDVVREETFFPLVPIVVPEREDDDALLEAFLRFVNSNDYGLRNSLWSRSDHVIETFVRRVVNGGTGRTGGAFGEANYPMLKTSHVQGVSIARGVSPYDAVFGA